MFTIVPSDSIILKRTRTAGPEWRHVLNDITAQNLFKINESSRFFIREMVFFPSSPFCFFKRQNKNWRWNKSEQESQKFVIR